jgi:short-subunit dehydrogenase
LETKTIVITGASGSLGSAIIEELLKSEENYQIIAISRKPLNNFNDLRINNLLVDLNKINGIEKNIRNYIGNTPIDCIINCAGICKSKEFTERKISSIIEQINVNLTSTILVCRLLLDNLSEGSHIINISSLMGRIPSKYYTVYSATKFGLVGFGEALRMELLERNIKVSTVLPSLFESKMADGAKTPNIIKPVPSDEIAKEVVNIMFRHSGLKTIGLLSALSVIVERFMPLINRKISASV